MLHTLILAATLSGTVVLHHKSGVEEPVAAALVEVSELDEWHVVIATAMTGTDGTFVMKDVHPGHYRCDVTSTQGQMSGFITVSADPGDPPRTLYLFDPTCHAKFGRVRDALTGDAIADARVAYIFDATTDSGGNYFIDFGCFAGPGFQFHNTFVYRISADGYRTLRDIGGRGETEYGGLRDFDLRPLRTQRGPERPWNRATARDRS